MQGVAYIVLYGRKLEPETWYSYCASYSQADHSLAVVLDGNLVITKKDPDNLADRAFNNDMVEKLTISKDNVNEQVIGQVTNFNMWSQVVEN